MSQKVNYFKIGIFMLVGLSILFAVVVFVGGSAILEKTIPAETYFNESVQGLDVGAPVKYRGVTIGNVSAIDFVVNKYPPEKERDMANTARYVLVEMKLKARVVDNFFDLHSMREWIQKTVDYGLRARLTTQGLTGVAFLELTFFDPKLNPPLPISWTPQHVYFPSAPSTMSRLEDALDAVGAVMRDIETIDFSSLVATLNGFIANLDTALVEADVKDIGALLVKSLKEAHEALAQINTLVKAPEAATILPDAAHAMASARAMLKNGEKDFSQTMANIRSAAEHLSKVSATADQLLADPGMKQGVGQLPDTLRNVKAASDDIRRSASELERLLRSLNDLVLNQSANIDTILEDAKTLLHNFNELTGDAKRNPARLFFGAPPDPVNTEKRP